MQKKESIIRSFEKLQREHASVQKEITELERKAHALVIDQKEKAAKVEPEAMDGVIGSYQKKIQKIKSRIDGLRIKKEALESAMEAKQREFKQNEIRVFRKEYEFLKLESAKVRKERDEAEQTYRQLDRRVDQLAGRRLNVWEKITKLESELRKPSAPKAPEEKQAERLEQEYQIAQRSIYKEWDNLRWAALKQIDYPKKRLERLKELQANYTGILKGRENYFGRPIVRPPDRPDIFENFSLEQLSRVPYDDVVKLYNGSSQEKGKLIKKYTGQEPKAVQ